MSIEAIRELEALASVCPELNMANYTEDDVRHLNDWAIEVSLLIERTALSQQPATPEPALLLDALQAAKATLVAFKFIRGDANCWEPHDEDHLTKVDAAISAMLAAK